MYLLKEQSAKLIKEKYRNTYIEKKTGLCKSYVSLIINRKKALPKQTAYIFTKTINSELEIDDLFDNKE